MPTPFYPICTSCGHAHTEDSLHFFDTTCCAYCPKCESLAPAVTRNRMISVVHHSSSPGTGWQEQWCRGMTSRGLPCKNRAPVYVISDVDPEQYYCPSHISQHPKAYQKNGRWVIGR